MSLTVPQAGVIAGRAPNMAAVPVVASDAGGAVAGLGDKMLQIGTAIEEERSQREVAAAKVKAMQGLNDLRLEFEQNGSPDDIDKNFAPRAQELRQQILGGLSARSQGPGAEMFDELQAAHGFELGKRAIDLRQSERMATTAQMQQTVITTASNADPTAQSVMLGQFDDHVDQMVANGTMMPEDAQKLKMETAAALDNSAASKLLDSDPAKLIAALDDPKNPGFSRLSQERRVELRGQAVNQLRADAAKAEARGKVAEKERLANATTRLKDGIDSYRAGRPFADAETVGAMLADPTIAALPEAREYAHAQALAKAMPEFTSLPLAAQKRILAEEQKSAISKGYEANLAEAMQSAVSAAEEGLAKDPISYAAKMDWMDANPLPDPVAGGADDFATAFGARARGVDALVSNGYLPKKQYFTPAEAESLKAAVAPSNSPEQLVKLSSALAAGFGEDADVAAAQIGADPVFRMVGGMLANGGNEGVARRVFNGRRLMETKDIQLPPEKARRSLFFKEFYGLFSDGTVQGEPDEKPVRDAIIAATDALYAAETFDDSYVRKSTNDPIVIDEDRWKDCLHKVLAGSGGFDDDLATGGVQKVMGQITLMPRGVSGRALERNIETVAKAGPDAWKAISASDSVPLVGGVPVSDGDLKSWGSWQLSLTPLYNGQFALQTLDPTTGKMAVLTDAKGAPYRIDADKLASFGGGQ